MNIKTVAVLGANGTMGCNVAGIFAGFGNAQVYMISRTMEKSMNAIDKAAKSVKADAIRRKLIPADYSMLESCLSKSDLIFECVSENFETKLELNKRIASIIAKDKIICTGTSGILIKSLAEAFPEDIRKNYMGLHFYNPPYNMTLCELIPSIYTDNNITCEVKKYITNILYRTVVVVKDTPAFLGNRIGFQFINEALQYAVKYKDNGGIDYIDGVLGHFTGRNMPPLSTSNFVGLDVHKAIVDNIYINTNDYAKDTFILPQFAASLIEEGKLGRKTKEGLYKLEESEEGLKRCLVYDISSQKYRDKIRYRFPFAVEMITALKVGDYENAFNTLIINHSNEAEICLEFLLKYVLYSLNVSLLIGDGIHSADDVMATGFNWCPPLSIIQALGGINKFKSLVYERINKKIISQMDLEKLFKNVEVSKYDYRRYFNAKY